MRGGRGGRKRAPSQFGDRTHAVRYDAKQCKSHIRRRQLSGTFTPRKIRNRRSRNRQSPAQLVLRLCRRLCLHRLRRKRRLRFLRRRPGRKQCPPIHEVGGLQILNTYKGRGRFLTRAPRLSAATGTHRPPADPLLHLVPPAGPHTWSSSTGVRLCGYDKLEKNG